MALKQLDTKSNSEGVEFKNPNTAHPWARGFKIVHVDTEAELIVSFAQSDFAKEIYAIELTAEVPEHFPNKIRHDIISWLLENNFDDSDGDICIISPFIPSFRGFMIEVFPQDKAEIYLSQIAKDANLKVLGCFELTQNDFVEESKIKTIGDSEIDSKIKSLKEKEEQENNTSVEKANVVNKRLW